MAVRQRRYSKEELAERGQAQYESSIRQQVEAGNEGKIVAIDIAESETEPLLGLATLRGYRLQVDNVDGSIVKIEAL
jgi:predicted aspartyl protease